MTEIKWLDATRFMPLPKDFSMYQYSVEVISSEGDLVCWDYKDKEWKEIVIEGDSVYYVPIQIKEWTNKPYKENKWILKTSEK